VTGQPLGLAITPDGRTLLATCSGTAQVIAIDAQRPNRGSRKTLSVGNMPFEIAVTPTGGYAFVGNMFSGSVSVLDVWGGPSNCSVVGAPIMVGGKPTGLVTSPDGLMVVVPKVSENSLSVVTLLTYSPETLLTQVGQQPTDVVAAPDGKSALIWHDGFMSTGAVIPGVRYYSTASGVASSMLDDILVAGCVFSPVTPGLVFAIGTQGPLLFTADLTDPSNPVESNVQLVTAAKTTTCGLAISGDGATLFVLLSDAANQHTLLVGSVKGSVFTQTQSLPVYVGQWPGPVTLRSTIDGESLFIVDAQNQQALVVRRDTTRHYSVASLASPIANPVTVAVLPDGTKAFVLQSGSPNAITMVDLATLAPTSVALTQSYVQLRDLAISPDGRRLFATDLSAGALRVLDPGSLRILHTIPLAQQIRQAQGSDGIAIAPDGSRIYVANTGSATVSVMRQVTI
jgi:DNA-binding beta-propeller fold protein YncE